MGDGMYAEEEIFVLYTECTSLSIFNTWQAEWWDGAAEGLAIDFQELQI